MAFEFQMILLRYKSGRRKVRVFNADCYDAKSEECHCICGGKNHAKGEAEARRNGAIYFEELASRTPGLTVERHQMALFETSAEENSVEGV
jgi:hypothetical protein